jgi:hypothetical protein
MPGHQALRQQQRQQQHCARSAAAKGLNISSPRRFMDQRAYLDITGVKCETASNALKVLPSAI